MIALALVSIAVLAIMLVAGVLIFVLKNGPAGSKQDAYLKAHGVRAKGKIIRVEETGKNLPHTSYPLVKLFVMIYLPDTEPYTSSITVPVSYRSFPAQGMPVKVIVHPQNPQSFIFGE